MRAPPRGQKRDFGCAPAWCSNLDSESNVGPESVEVGLDGYDTNVGGVIESDVNLGLGSWTVDSPSPPRVQNSISDRGLFGVASPILGKRTRTEVETPPSKLALVLSPPSLFFTQIDGGDSVNGVGTRSAPKDRVRVPDPSRIMSRYTTISSRSERKRSRRPSSHGSSLTDAVKSVVGTTNVVNARTPDRPGVEGLRDVSGKVQHVEDRSSLADVQSSNGEDGPEQRRESPRAATVGAGKQVSLIRIITPLDHFCQTRRYGAVLRRPGLRRLRRRSCPVPGSPKSTIIKTPITHCDGA